MYKNILPFLKISYHKIVCGLFLKSKMSRSLITQQDFPGKRFLPGIRRPGKLNKK